MTILTISNSEIQTYKDCRRRWYIQYYLQRQPKAKSVTGATNLGTKVHAALEAYYDPMLEKSPSDALSLLRAMYTLDRQQNLSAEQLEDLADEEDLANIMLTGYFDWLADTGADSNLHVQSVEREIKVQVTDNIILRGRLDSIVIDKHAGSFMFLDHKTCIQWLDKDYLDRDEQSKFYMMLQRLEQPNAPSFWCAGGIFNMLRKVKRTAKAKPPFYKRESIEHNRDTLNSMYQRTIQVCNEIIELREQLDDGVPYNQVAYPHPGKDCVWKCPLASGLCSMMDDGSDWWGYAQDKWELTDPYARYTEVGYLERLDQEGLL